MKTIKALFFAIVIAFSQSSIMAQRGSTVRGLVSDELGGVIVGATVSLASDQGKIQTTVSDAGGMYRFNGVAPGNYSIVVAQTGFGPFQETGITLAGDQSRTINVTLKVAALEGQVTVDPGAAVNLDPTANKSALVLKGNDLNALSDDPTELAAELSALAGPAAGPSGAQVFALRRRRAGFRCRQQHYSGYDH